MKKWLARVLAVLLVLNLGVFPTAYAVTQYPDPVLYNSSIGESTFKFNSGVAGTLYYVVTRPDMQLPTAAELKALAIASVKTLPVVAGNSVTVSTGVEGTISIAGLKDGTYKLMTTTETNGVLTAVTMKEFTTLFFEMTPSITQIKSDTLDLTFKLNGSGYLYYGVYTDATGVTASDVINSTASPNFVYGSQQMVTNGVQSTVIIPGLEGKTNYDIVLVRKDMMGNYSQVTTVLNDVQTLGNKLISAVYTKATSNTDDDRIYLYFSEDVVTSGAAVDYQISFVDDSGTGKPGYTLSSVADPDPDYTIVGVDGNRVEIALNPYLYDVGLTSDNFTYGHMTVAISPVQLTPHLDPSFATASFQITSGLMSGSNSQPLMALAEYKYDGSEDGAEGDYVLVTLDSDMTTSSSAINFELSFGSPSNVLLQLIPDTDYTYEEKTSNSFSLNLTSAGAVKVNAANLPTTLFKVAYKAGSEPQAFNMHIPFIYGYRDSSTSSLSALAIYGVPVPNFNPTVLSYSVNVPYILLESYNSTPAAGIHATPTMMGSRLFIMPQSVNQSMIEVIALDGTATAYNVTTLPNVLTLGGIAINGKLMSGFDPYATSYAYTMTEIFTAAPTLTVNYAAGVSPTITSAPHSSIANTYVYTIVLTKDGVSATYTVTVTGGASSNSGTDNREDNGSGGSSGSGGNFPIPGGGTIPTDADIAKFLDPAKEFGNFVLPPDLANLTNLNFSLNFVKDTINSVLSEQQAVDTLSKMDDVMKQVNAGMTAKPEEVAQFTQMMTNLTTGTEEKLSLITNLDQQLVVLDQLMVEVKLFKGQVATPTPDLDKSVQELVQKTANNFGTFKITAPVTAEPIKLDSANLAATIAKQTEAITKLNELQKAYFETGIAKAIKQELKIVAETPTGLGALKVELAADQISTLKTAKIDSLTVSNVNAEIKVPVINFGATNAVQLVIEKMPQATTNPQPGEPTLVYEMSLVVNNEKQEKFSKPITLGFSLVVFKLDKESPNELAIFKKNEATNVWDPVGGIVDPEADKIFVTRDNLSQYTVLKSKKSFSDADNSWAKAEINAMLSKGIVADSGKFNPQSALTRGEFAQWIAKAYGLKVSSASLPFKDVAQGGDEYAAIAAVYEQGLLSGKSKTSFDPKGAVTQNEMAAALGKLLVSFDNKAKSDKATSKYLSQLKTTQVATWAEDDMALLMELGLNISGSTGKDPVTKEAAAAAFMKFYRS